MIDLVIKCSEFVLDLIIKKKVSRDDRNELISAELKKIASLLESVALSLEKDVYPSGACSTMQIFSDHLISRLEGKLEDSLLAELELSLRSASEFERLYAERNPQAIDEIKKASGRFEAAAILIKL